MKYSKNQKEEFIQLYKKGLTIRDIIKKLNVSYYSVYITLKNENLLRNWNNKIKCNTSYFNDIDSHNKAYILGFIAADGYIGDNSLQIHINSKDIELLNFINKELETNIVLKSKDNKVKLNICKKEIIKDLRNLGFTKNKTFDLTFPNISSKFINSFILGYFDGDGCIHIRKNGKGQSITICCTKSFGEVLQIELNKYNIVSLLNKKESIYNLNIFKKDSVLNFYNEIYKDSDFYLERKQIKFKQIKQKTNV